MLPFQLQTAAPLTHSATASASRCAQISRAILNEQQKFKVPKWFNEDKPPVTKAELEEKIDQLHAAINEVASSVGPERPKASSLGQINNEVLEKAGHS